MRSNETIVVLQALKALHVALDELHEEVRGIKEYLQRMEETGITINLPFAGSDASDGSETQVDDEEEIQMV